jgi:hypothetical protein
MKNLVLALAATVALASNATLVLAETVTTTTVETTSAAPFTLSASENYVVVNPAGVEVGPYDYTTRLINGQPVPYNAYVIEKTSGRVIATTDTSGNIIAFTTVPTVLPSHFILRNGVLFFLGSDYSARRAQIEAQINADFAAGHLSNRNVKELQEELAEIASLEAKRRSDGTYRTSTARQIEKKFSHLQSEYSEDVAEINSKRAKIGINNN